MRKQDKLINEIIGSIQDKKGIGITFVDLSSIEGTSAQNFVICTATSATQVEAIADNVRQMVHANLGIKPFGYDGYQNAQWIVIDYGYVYVHVFLPETRNFYKLEQLWNDAKLTHVPDID